MNEFIDSFAEPKSLKKYLALATGYSVAVCTLYLWGYWSTFDINILQYADVSTILKLALFPILISFAGLTLGSMFGHFMFTADPSEGERSAAQNTRIGRWIRNNTQNIAGGWILLTLAFLVLGPRNKWDILSLLIALPIASVLHLRGFASDLLPDRNTRSGVIFLCVIAIPYAYASGLRSAELIEVGTQFSYLLSPIDGIDVQANAAAEVRPRFLGQVTDLLFFYSPAQKSVSIVKFDDKKALTLKKYAVPVEPVSRWFPDRWKTFINPKVGEGNAPSKK